MLFYCVYLSLAKDTAMLTTAEVIAYVKTNSMPKTNRDMNFIFRPFGVRNFFLQVRVLEQSLIDATKYHNKTNTLSNNSTTSKFTLPSDYCEDSRPRTRLPQCYSGRRGKIRQNETKKRSEKKGQRSQTTISKCAGLWEIGNEGEISLCTYARVMLWKKPA